MKAKLAALFLGGVAAMAGGAANAITFTYYGTTYCQTLTISPTGAITCAPTTPALAAFQFPDQLTCPTGLSISATKPRVVSCATTLPECTLSVTPTPVDPAATPVAPGAATPVAPGGAVSLTAICPNTTPTAYQWIAGPGLTAGSGTTATATVTVPSTTVPGFYAYSVTASNAVGTGSVASALVKVGNATGPVYIANETTGKVSVIDTSASPSSAVVTDAIKVGVVPTGVAVHATGTRSYVSNFSSGDISVIDAATGTAVPVPVLDAPAGVAVNPAGTRVYVANSGSNRVSVIDTSGNSASSAKVIGTPVIVGVRPFGVAVNQAGTRLYVTNQGDDTVSEIDITNDKNTVIGLPVHVGSKPFGVVVAGTQVFVANSGSNTVSVIDTAVSPYGVSTLTVGLNPTGIDVNPAGTTVYVVNSGLNDRTVSVIDVATRTVKDPVVVGEFRPNSSVSFNPTGTLAYVTKLDNAVSVIDVAANAVIPSAAITVGSGGLNAFGKFIAIPTAIIPGMWWDKNEPGWGISLAQRNGSVFGAFYTYDQAGLPTWYTMTCTLTGVSCPVNISRVIHGTPATDQTWAGAEPAVSAGSGTLTLGDANTGTFAFAIDGQPPGFKQIERYVFATGTTQPAVDYTDLWWNPSEAGWGVALTQLYGKMTVAWYTYESSRLATWYVAACTVVGSGCSDSLYKVTGGAPMASAWKASTQTPVGTISFTFTDANNGTMEYTINGVKGSKSIKRF